MILVQQYQRDAHPDLGHECKMRAVHPIRLPTLQSTEQEVLLS